MSLAMRPRGHVPASVGHRQKLAVSTTQGQPVVYGPIGRRYPVPSPRPPRAGPLGPLARPKPKLVASPKPVVASRPEPVRPEPVRPEPPTARPGPAAEAARPEPAAEAAGQSL